MPSMSIRLEPREEGQREGTRSCIPHPISYTLNVTASTSCLGWRPGNQDGQDELQG